jgi:hypothetical protein
VNKLVDGLQEPTGDAWLEHWDADDRLEDFYHLLRALSTVARAARATLDADAEAQHQHDTRQKIAEHFPELADQLRFVDATMDRAIRIIESIVKVTVPSHLRKDDAACAQRFNRAAKWYMLANASLRLIADGEGPESPALNVPTEVGAFIAGFSKHAALEAHHAAMEAARLRAPQASEGAEQDHVPSSSVPASSLIDRARASAKRGAAEVTEQLRRLRDQGKIDDNGSILVAWPDDMNAGSSTDL